MDYNPQDKRRNYAKLLAQSIQHTTEMRHCRLCRGAFAALLFSTLTQRMPQALHITITLELSQLLHIIFSPSGHLWLIGWVQLKCWQVLPPFCHFTKGQ